MNKVCFSDLGKDDITSSLFCFSDLSDNEIKWAEEGILETLEALKEVDLSNNKLVAFPALGPAVDELKEVDLSNNQIENIARGFFDELNAKKFKDL